MGLIFDDGKMFIEIKVGQPFLITSEQVLELMRNKKAEISLDGMEYKLQINDDCEECDMK